MKEDSQDIRREGGGKKGKTKALSYQFFYLEAKFLDLHFLQMKSKNEVKSLMLADFLRQKLVTWFVTAQYPSHFIF